MFAAYSIPVPQDTALEHTVKPVSPQAAYETGVTAEMHNTAMYETFLQQEGLPDDVRQIFEALMRASQNHQQAFEQNEDRTGTGGANAGGRGRPNSNGGNAPAQGRGWRVK